MTGQTRIKAARPRDPRPMSEFALQKYVVELLRFTAKPRVIWFAVPNGEARSKRTGARLKAMGVRPGVADIIVCVRGRVYFLELKTDKGRQSPAQRAFAIAADDAGCVYFVAHSPEVARSILEMWGAVAISGSVARRAA